MKVTLENVLIAGTMAADFAVGLFQGESVPDAASGGAYAAVMMGGMLYASQFVEYCLDRYSDKSHFVSGRPIVNT